MLPKALKGLVKSTRKRQEKVDFTKKKVFFPWKFIAQTTLDYHLMLVLVIGAALKCI